MTHHPADARPAFMVAARDRIEAAQQLKLEPGSKTRVRETLPDLYWSLIAEAAIYADLARADYATGLTAGVHLTEREARIEGARDRAREAVKRAGRPRVSSLDGTTEVDHAGHGCSFDRTAASRNVDDAPFAEGDDVRLIRGDWAGRAGVVAQVYPNNEPPIVDVELLLHYGEVTPKRIAVLPVDLELIGFGQ